MEAWTSTDDNAGVLVKVDALREQAREVPIILALYIYLPFIYTRVTEGGQCRAFCNPSVDEG